MDYTNWLRQIGIQTNCIEQKTVAKENKRTFQLVVNNDTFVRRVQIDGCWFSDNSSKKIDFLFLVSTAPQQQVVYFVELKGSRYKDALRQLDEFLVEFFRRWKKARLPSVKRKEAYIILSHGNSIPQYTFLKQKIEKTFGLKIYTASKSAKVNLDSSKE